MKKFYFLLLSFLALSLCANAAEKTGTITFGPSDVKVAAATVEANDNLGNSWTITTVGTTSFTNKNGNNYSQIGSKTSAATSITFAAKLPSSVTVNSVEAKFGGNSGTAGAISIKVGDTEVGTGSLKASNDVTVNSTTAAEGNAITISITDIAKGVKAYYITYTYVEPDAAVEKPAITETSIPDLNGNYFTTSTAKATIKCETDGAKIQYAITDGAEPADAEWSDYSAEVEIVSAEPAKKTLWAKAVKYPDESAVVSKQFTFIEKPELITYEQVTSESQIVPGRKYVIACTGASKMAVMSAISGKIFSAKNTDATTITCADSKLSFIKGDAVYVTFEKAAASFANGHADNLATTIWNVKIGDEYITSTTEKNMVMSADAPTNITMSIDAEGNFALKFDVNYFCYNAGSPRFTTYDSQGTSNNDMKIQLFREPEAMASVMSATAETAVELPVSVVGRKVFGNYLLASTVNNGGAQLESPSLAEAKHFWSNDPEKFNQESWIAIEGLDDNYVGKEFEVGQTLTAAGADDIYGFPTYTVATPSTSDYAGALAINNYSASNFNIGGTDEAVTNVWLVVPQLGEYCQIHGYVDAEKGADAKTAFVQANEESNLYATVYLNGLSEFKTSGWYNIEGVVAKDGEGLAIYATAVDTATGVEGVETSSVKVYGAEGVINVESEEVAPIAVYSANGAIVSSVEASSASIAVAPGFYIVKAGNSVSKVTVK